MSAPTSEEFQRWRDDTVTRWVFQALANTADDNKAAWSELSWEGGIADQSKLTEMKTRADAYRAIIDAPYEAHCESNGDDPIHDES